ncbi:MAG TPA: putative LPS assembly protein LptD [Sphingobacteriaceae bacterium]
MKFITTFFINSLLWAGALSVSAQDPVLKDTTAAVLTDTIRKTPVNSSSSFRSKISYSAEDSTRFDFKNNIVYLFGKARIKYEDFELDADYIRIDQKNKSVFARGSYDRRNRYQQRPIFKQGSEPPATTDSLAFNFETKKGLTYGGSYEVEGGFIQASQIKKNEFNEGFIKDAIYSTCNLRHPHFGIHISKGIVTDKQIITKVAYLQIDSVPLPIGVPFGFFPKTNRRASGILFPTFGEDFSRGFFMRDLGYYVGLNDYWDLAAYVTLYSKGSLDGRLQTRYMKRYKYDGSFNFRFGSNKVGLEGTENFGTNRDFNIQWTHTQRPEVNPGTTFSASVNAGTSSYFRNTGAGGTYDPTQLINNTLSSNISYSKSMGLFNFSSSLSHRQNIEDHSVYLQLPSFNLSMSTVNPFDSRDRVGEQKWFQRITVGYNARGENTINTKDSLLFRSESLKDFRNGIQHNVPISFSTNVLDYFQFNLGGNYSEQWVLQTIRQRYSDSLRRPVTDTVPGFRRAYDYSFSTGLATKLYGQKNFRKGKLLALRHVMTPSLSFTYRPDFGDERFGVYRSVQADSTGRQQRYSIFQNSVFGSGPSPGRQAMLGFVLDNNLEAKVRSNADSLTNTAKVPILRNLSFRGSYNFAASDFRLSPINFSGSTALFKQKLDINFSGIFDPYQLDSVGTRINVFELRRGRLARLTSFGASTNFSFNSEAVKSRNNNLQNQRQNLGALTPQQAEELASISRDPAAFVDFRVPWNISAGYNFQYSKSGLESTITNTLDFQGDLNVTEKWKVAFVSGYDFVQTKFALTSFSIYRDLHCWDMSFSWIPYGPWKSYSFTLRAKASLLQDLKLSRRGSHFSSY